MNPFFFLNTIYLVTVGSSSSSTLYRVLGVVRVQGFMASVLAESLGFSELVMVKLCVADRSLYVFDALLWCSYVFFSCPPSSRPCSGPDGWGVG